VIIALLRCSPIDGCHSSAKMVLVFSWPWLLVQSHDAKKPTSWSPGHNVNLMVTLNFCKTTYLGGLTAKWGWPWDTMHEWTCIRIRYHFFIHSMTWSILIFGDRVWSKLGLPLTFQLKEVVTALGQHCYEALQKQCLSKTPRAKSHLHSAGPLSHVSFSLTCMETLSHWEPMWQHSVT
jgi:hypothetical protein